MQLQEFPRDIIDSIVDLLNCRDLSSCIRTCSWLISEKNLSQRIPKKLSSVIKFIKHNNLNFFRRSTKDKKFDYYELKTITDMMKTQKVSKQIIWTVFDRIDEINSGTTNELALSMFSTLSKNGFYEESVKCIEKYKLNNKDNEETILNICCDTDNILGFNSYCMNFDYIKSFFEDDFYSESSVASSPPEISLITGRLITHASSNIFSKFLDKSVNCIDFNPVMTKYVNVFASWIVGNNSETIESEFIKLFNPYSSWKSRELFLQLLLSRKEKLTDFIANFPSFYYQCCKDNQIDFCKQVPDEDLKGIDWNKAFDFALQSKTLQLPQYISDLHNIKIYTESTLMRSIECDNLEVVDYILSRSCQLEDRNFFECLCRGLDSPNVLQYLVKKQETKYYFKINKLIEKKPKIISILSSENLIRGQISIDDIIPSPSKTYNDNSIFELVKVCVPFFPDTEEEKIKFLQVFRYYSFDLDMVDGSWFFSLLPGNRRPTFSELQFAHRDTLIVSIITKYKTSTLKYLFGNTFNLTSLQLSDVIKRYGGASLQFLFTGSYGKLSKKKVEYVIGCGIDRSNSFVLTDIKRIKIDALLYLIDLGFSVSKDCFCQLLECGRTNDLRKILEKWPITRYYLPQPMKSKNRLFDDYVNSHGFLLDTIYENNVFHLDLDYRDMVSENFSLNWFNTMVRDFSELFQELSLFEI